MENKVTQTAVVIGVGAKKGLGAALCRRFAKAGFHVFAAGRTKKKLVDVVDEIKDSGGEATDWVCDATAEDQVVRLFDAADAHGSGLGVAIYNAGNNSRKPLLEMSATWFENTWRVACYGGFLCGREAARHLTPKSSGTILFTGATASIRGKPPFTAFASAKAGLRSLAQSMAREFGPTGVHVAHVIIDGGINGELLISRAPDLIQKRGEDGLLNIDSIAEAFWYIHRQPKTAWSFEIDLRPYKEPF